jgi:hypothetical protein
VSPILGIFASAQQGALAVGDYESIATVTVGSGGTTSVAFTSIPSTYQHLQIRGIVKTDRAGTSDYFKLRINSDTTSTNYAYHEVGGNGSSTVVNASANSTNQVVIERIAAGQQASSTFGATVIDILDYANTNKNKTVRSLTGFEDNSSNTGQIYLGSGLWTSTSAITQINLLPGGGTNILQYSTFALYGIKG